MPAKRPNIIFILTDDMGWGDLAAHGHPYLKTPNLSRLAAEGLCFDQFYTCSPVCSPSRVGFLTGVHPSRFAIHRHFSNPDDNAAWGMPNWLDPEVTTIADL